MENQALREILSVLEEYDYRLRYNRLQFLFPAQGAFSRELYPKHIAFLHAGARYRERFLFGANRVGKTFIAGYEVALHLTGRYPDWYEGKRFAKPVLGIGLGVSLAAVKNVIQDLLCGNHMDFGSGLIPKEDLVLNKCKFRPNTNNLFEQIVVKHHTNGVFDGYSTFDLNSYVAGSDVIQGTNKMLTWEDEENPDPEIHSELVTRTALVDGISLTTFTPRNNWTELLLSVLPERRFPVDCVSKVLVKDAGQQRTIERYVTRIDWDDAPHMTPELRAELLASYQPHEIEARSKGIPGAGSNKIYTSLLEDIIVPAFKIPPYWPRAYGLDVGWNKTAALWATYSEESDTIYIYDEYYSGEKHFSIHAYNLMLRSGEWMIGAIDPAAIGSGKQKDGIGLLEEYRKYGLDLVPANNAVEAGISKVASLLVQGKLKIFANCSNTINEYMMYARDDDGKIKKKADHLMDALRYLIMSFFYLLRVNPEFTNDDKSKLAYYLARSGVNPTTGY